MEIDKKLQPSTAQKKEGSDHSPDGDWLRRAQKAYQTSTTYVDQNLRQGWVNGINSFNNQHAQDSKFNAPAYDKRSKLFRPKIRSVIRKNEAAAASAFFSNMDVTSVLPTDQSDKLQVASAEIMKELLQYRLTKSIPWFQTLIGGLQDAQTVGTVCAHVYWEYEAAVQPEAEDDEVEDNSEEEYPEQVELPDGATAVGSTPDEGYDNEENPTHLREPKPITMQAAVAPLPPATQMPGQPPAPQQPAGQNPQMQQPAPPPGQPVPSPQMSQPAPKLDAKAGFKDQMPAIKAKTDKPCVQLIPVENLRIDPSSDWIDPITSSPYVIHLIPMYAMDIMSKMDTGEWRKYGMDSIRTWGATNNDVTRSARNKQRDDPLDSNEGGENDYDVCWVQRHIHRREGQDWEFYTIGTQALLSTPRPLEEVVFHGKRPYVMGNCILETHKLNPSSVGELGKGLQDEANEVVNQRIDNVKFVLNKKWFAKRGKDVDVNGLIRNVPGGVVLMDDPETDVKEISWPDVTQSAYEEQSRIDNDISDLLGNFSPAAVMADHGVNGPARNMAMLGQSAGTLVEYLLRTYVETFVQPVLRQLVLLEQEYETDQVILTIAAKKANALQKYGLTEITDQILEQELTLTVNVGMGATDPNMKLQKFIGAMSSYTQMMQKPPPGVNMQEVGKEIFGCLGYSDGQRFFTSEDPQVALLAAQLQQMQHLLNEANMKLKDKTDGHAVKAAATEHTNLTRLQMTREQLDAKKEMFAIEHKTKMAMETKKQGFELMKHGLEHSHSTNTNNLDHEQAMGMSQIGHDNALDMSAQNAAQQQPKPSKFKVTKRATA